MRPERTRFPGARVVMQFRRIDPPWGLSLRELDVLTLLSLSLIHIYTTAYVRFTPSNSD